jgi:hypothetical protein
VVEGAMMGHVAHYRECTLSCSSRRCIELAPGQYEEMLIITVPVLLPSDPLNTTRPSLGAVKGKRKINEVIINNSGTIHAIWKYD